MVYTAFALSTLGFVAFAMTQSVDLVSVDYYEEALQHDRMQQARANVRAHSITAVVIGGVLKIHNAGKTDASSMVDISWKRAQNPAMDCSYEVPLTLLATEGLSTVHLAGGRWDVRVTWKRGRDAFQIDTVVVL